MGKIWKKVKGFNNYEVSNYGEVRNITTNKILKPRISDRGYCSVVLYNGTIKSLKSFRIHRLVLATFDNVDYINEYECNHKDEDKNNNQLYNLNWVTRKENMDWNNLQIRIKRNPRTKPIKKTCLINGTFEIFKSSSIASKDGFDRGHIINCLKKRRKHYKGYIWEYI